MLRDGIDPGVERKRAQLAAELGAANTFGAVAEGHIEQKLIKKGLAVATIDKTRWLLLQLSAISSQPIAEIEAMELYAFLRHLEGQRKHETVKRCSSFARLRSHYGNQNMTVAVMHMAEEKPWAQRS